MPKSNMTVTRVAELCARLINRESQASIGRTMGVHSKTLEKAIKALRAHGVAIETRKPSRLSPEREARLHNLFRSTLMSNRAIVAETGVALESVNKSRRRFNAEVLKSGGELPKCDCGQDLHHARMCWVRHRQHMKNSGIRSVVTLSNEDQIEVRNRLLAGDTVRSVAERFGLPKMSVGGFLRSLSSDDRRVRNDTFLVAAARRRASKLADSISRPRATNPAADPLYAEIAKSVSRRIDPALRDDMISQAYLEVLEGRLDPKHLREGMRKVRGRVFSAFANPWGNLSIDAPTREDGTGSWVENIPDERALQAFDAVA
ncbi:hypothetical protein U1872_07950 [Sphingomonas sp. RB3P16]|uniref:hypothetical protein n=1 Tax=Parasphingomonas frigoris TaxID=3096163 RepID=UPI002FC80D2A